MEMPHVIDELLHFACPSIRQRVRREILMEKGASRALEADILQDGAVSAVLDQQGEDGWIGQGFHGYDGMEAGMRLLCEKGLDRECLPLRRALEALEEAHRDKENDRLSRGIGKVSDILEGQGFDGKYRIAASLFARAGLETHPLVQEQEQEALEAFRGVLAVNDMQEMARPHKGKLVFQAGVKWPGIYSLRLLAFTHGWRDPGRREMVTQAVRRLVRLSPLPEVHILHKSQLVAPAGFGMQDFNPDMEALSPGGWMAWFQRMELCARLGVVREVPELEAQVKHLERMLAEGRGWFVMKLTHDNFKHWGAYTGLMLEADWRLPKRRQYDLTFRSLLIGHQDFKE